MTLVTDLQYFTVSSSIINSLKYSDIYFPLYQIAKKTSFANRCIVSGSEGLITLSVPLVGGRGQRSAFKEVRICNRDGWRKRHWRTLESCYGRAPFFEFYKDSVHPFFEREYDYLIDLDQDITSWVMKALRFPGRLHFVLDESGMPSHAFENSAWKFLPNNYLESPSSPRYMQPFQEAVGFHPNLSIIDLLFCAGPDIINQAAPA